MKKKKYREEFATFLPYMLKHVANVELYRVLRLDGLLGKVDLKNQLGEYSYHECVVAELYKRYILKHFENLDKKWGLISILNHTKKELFNKDIENLVKNNEAWFLTKGRYEHKDLNFIELRWALKSYDFEINKKED